jgi:hypothetical protein
MLWGVNADVVRGQGHSGLIRSKKHDASKHVNLGPDQSEPQDTRARAFPNRRPRMISLRSGRVKPHASNLSDFMHNDSAGGT